MLVPLSVLNLRAAGDRALQDMCFWVLAPLDGARTDDSGTPTHTPASSFAENTGIGQPKAPLSCRSLPRGVWLHLLEFLPAVAVAGTLARVWYV